MVIFSKFLPPLLPKYLSLHQRRAWKALSKETILYGLINRYLKRKNTKNGNRKEDFIS